MSRRRQLLPPLDASTEGARRLRELLRTTKIIQIARKLRCDEGAVRHHARCVRTPSERMRDRFREVFGWPVDVWDRAPDDAYAGDEPATTRNPDTHARAKRPIRTDRPTS